MSFILPQILEGNALGEYKVDKQGRVLYFYMSGTMDAETAKNYYLAVKQFLPEFKSTWASLVDLNDWGLHIPEVKEQMAGFHKWIEKHGHEVEVCVIGKSKLKRMAREELLESSNSLLNVVYVETLDEGWQWLEEHGYLADA